MRSVITDNIPPLVFPLHRQKTGIKEMPRIAVLGTVSLTIILSVVFQFKSFQLIPLTTEHFLAMTQFHHDMRTRLMCYIY